MEDTRSGARTDVEGLPPEQAEAVTEIAQMLFVQGDLRVTSASYAIIPPLDLHVPSAVMDQLARLRAVLAYLYSSPHEVFDNVFLSPEEVSLALFTPSPVHVFLVRPEHHTQSVAPITGPALNKHHDFPDIEESLQFSTLFLGRTSVRVFIVQNHI